MIKKTLFISVISILLFYSCEENFSPKADYQRRYALNCVINYGQEYQIASVSTSYDVPGFDPYKNTDDPFLSNVLLRIWVNDSVFVFQDSVEERSDQSRYKNPLHFYYLDNFEAKLNDSIYIEAVLPNGNILSSRTKLPKQISTVGEGTDISIPPDSSDDVSIVRTMWTSEDKFLIYQPKAVIPYQLKQGGVTTNHEKEVPIEYLQLSGEEIAVFPIPSFAKSLNIQMSAIERALLDISGDDDKRDKYTIFPMIIKIAVYDKNLSDYYSSTSRIIDEYSVRLDEIDFTNIDGGFGVFGSYSIQYLSKPFDAEYVRSFGYRYLF
ncbi:MAG: DUF4249 family protein [Melioribacteraceae bacterium]|nr:DUF4249 family protein [Melioribacteraceae bacterium]MCF8356664.1 DUF4249 family protein [Melioribacteraceae bacterium]MCF8396290.1 DUF4249 family protein [Melioribacteraceae bacterium]MCF8419875.1 DUF4249 family protein [Melioribacteraceae bacterium]